MNDAKTAIADAIANGYSAHEALYGSNGDEMLFDRKEAAEAITEYVRKQIKEEDRITDWTVRNHLIGYYDHSVQINPERNRVTDHYSCDGLADKAEYAAGTPELLVLISLSLVADDQGHALVSLSALSKLIGVSVKSRLELLVELGFLTYSTSRHGTFVVLDLDAANRALANAFIG